MAKNRFWQAESRNRVSSVVITCKGSMHFDEIFFLKNHHPLSFSPAFSRHNGGLGMCLGLKPEGE